MCGGVLANHALARAGGDGAAVRVGNVAEVVEDVIARAGDEDFAVGFEDLVEAFPPVADDWHSARGGFEEADAWRPAGADHFFARHVQCESERVVELAMLFWCEMHLPF